MDGVVDLWVCYGVDFGKVGRVIVWMILLVIGFMVVVLINGMSVV